MEITDQVAAEAKRRLMRDCDGMKGLLGGLAEPGRKVATDVHAIRKLGKSLRGGFHVFGMGDTAAREIQAIGRLLAAPRDAVSRQSTWRKLKWSGDGALAEAIEALLDGQVRAAARRPNREVLDWCHARVDSALLWVKDLPDEEGRLRLAGGIAKLRKKLKIRCKRLSRRNEEDFHEVRKAVKAWLGATVLLPELILEAVENCDELAEVLGDENDLATLSEWLLAHGFTGRFAPGLWSSIDAKRLALQNEAIALVKCT